MAASCWRKTRALCWERLVDGSSDLGADFDDGESFRKNICDTNEGGSVERYTVLRGGVSVVGSGRDLILSARTLVWGFKLPHTYPVT